MPSPSPAMRVVLLVSVVWFLLLWIESQVNRCRHTGYQVPLARHPGLRQSSVTAARAGLPLRTATHCSRLARDEINTKARIAPATAKPAPTRNARSNPMVSATDALRIPEWKRLWVRLLAIVARIASPSAPPSCCEVLIRPAASPASCGLVPMNAAIVTDTNANPNPTPASSDGPSTSATYEPPGAGTRENQIRPPAISSNSAISVGLNPIRVTSREASPAATTIPTASGRYETPVLIGEKCSTSWR